MDGPDDYISGNVGDYFDEIMQMDISTGESYSVNRTLPRSCCYYADFYKRQPDHLDDWYRQFLSSPPGMDNTEYHSIYICIIEVRAMVDAVQQPSAECTAFFTVYIV